MSECLNVEKLSEAMSRTLRELGEANPCVNIFVGENEK